MPLKVGSDGRINALAWHYVVALSSRLEFYRGRVKIGIQMPKKSKDREKELLKLKDVLLEERKKLVEHMLRIKSDSDSELGSLAGDSADVASVEISQSSLHKLGNRERGLLSKIDHALAKFEDGTYGICELTGEEIPIERLKARPVAQYTVEAKEELERRERGFRGNSGDDSSFDYEGDL